MENALFDAGFSKNETKVYLTLLRLGSSTAGVTASKCDVHRTNVYDALDRLAEKGLVTYVYKGNKKFFEAVEPSRIEELLKERLTRFQHSLPSLLLDYRLSKTKDRVHIYEGLAGIKAITDNILKEGKPVDTFGVPRDTPERMKTILPLFHKKRIEKKMFMRHLYDANAQERIAYINSLPYSEATYLPQDIEESPATTTIYGNKVTFFIWSTPQLSILIESERMADRYRKFFAVLWDMAVRATQIPRKTSALP